MPPASDTDSLARDDVAARCEQMIGVVAAAGTTAQRSGWLQQLLTRLLESPEGGKSGKEFAVTLQVCERLVAQMMETLLLLEEQRGRPEAAVGLDEQMANTLQALSLFCNARPKLLLHHAGDDTLSILCSLLIYPPIASLLVTTLASYPLPSTCHELPSTYNCLYAAYCLLPAT